MFAHVIVDHRACWLKEPLTYSVPPDLQGLVAFGAAVEVPFGNRQLAGFVVALSVSQSALQEEQIRPLTRILQDAPFFSQEQLELVEWLRTFYGGNRLESLYCVIPGPVLAQLRRLTKKPRAVKKLPRRLAEHYPRQVLTPIQQSALEECWRTTLAGGTTLIQGVTGSGKTEVYLHLVERTLAQDRSVIVLVPEVSLTPQAIERYQGRLGDTVAVLHSGLADPERREQWRRLRDKECRVALGTRSAVFAPVEDLGLVILDEEHDHSYKQEQSPRYHARQVAHWRCQFQTRHGHHCGVILGSATPSLESLYSAQQGRSARVLMSERATGGQLPTVQMIDLRKTRWGKACLSPPLLDRLRVTLARGEQCVLLYNRRGFANFVQCHDCAEVVTCPNCSVSLVFHRTSRSLRCHYCDFSQRNLDACPACQGPFLDLHGAGTQKVEDELLEKVPGIRILRMDRDTTTRPGSHAEILGSFGRHEADVLLGTQMVAKGLDFPKVTLVGVLSADAGLHLPDFRSSERTFQMLTQVAGRAGRGLTPGHVVIQAYDLDNPCLVAVQRQDYAGFSEHELALRKAAHYPPYCRLVRIVISGPDEDDVARIAAQVGARLKGVEGVQLVGPAPCPIARLRSSFRWHCLLKGRRVKDLADIVRTRLEFRKLPEHVRVIYDPDPLSLM